MSVSEKDFESVFINEEAFTIMKAITESTEKMLDVFKRLKKKFEVMQKERKSDRAVIHKLLRDIKTLKKIRTGKTIPKKGKRAWRKKIVSKILDPLVKKKNVAKEGNGRIGNVGQLRNRWRKKETTVHKEVDVYKHFPQLSWSTYKLSNTLITCSVIRKRKNSSPPQVVKKFKTDTSIQVISNN